MRKLLRLRLRSITAEARPTNLELFFDLVFVVVIAQLSDLITTHPSPKVFLEYFGLFGITFFTWVGFTTYADRFDVDDSVHRLIVFAASLANIGVAIHLDDAFTGGSVPFTLATIATRACLLAVTDRARRKVPEARAFEGYYEVRWAVGLAVWIVSLFVPVPWRYVVWGIALAIEIGTPLIAMPRIRTLPLVSSHIAERFGLFPIIVLGESVVSVAAGIADVNFELQNSIVAVGAFVLAAAVWWLYFDCVTTVHADSTWYVYLHGPLYAGLGLVAPGTLLAIDSAGEATLPGGARAALCGGIALYLFGVCAIELASRPPPSARARALARAGTGAFVLGLAFVGGVASPVATMLLLVGAVVGELCFELATLRRSSPG
jgi:low temperature requirement protein LtrA